MFFAAVSTKYRQPSFSPHFRARSPLHLHSLDGAAESSPATCISASHYSPRFHKSLGPERARVQGQRTDAAANGRTCTRRRRTPTPCAQNGVAAVHHDSIYWPSQMILGFYGGPNLHWVSVSLLPLQIGAALLSRAGVARTALPHGVYKPLMDPLLLNGSSFSFVLYSRVDFRFFT